MGSYRIDSLAQLPEGMRRQAAEKLLKLPTRGVHVAAREEKTESKYHNKKTVVNGIAFDSRKEARRYQELLEAVRLGAVEDLRLQAEFTLVEAYTDAQGNRHQAMRYKADFTYRVKDAGYDKLALLGSEDIEYWRSLGRGALVIEDVKSKGTRTRVYINKEKLMADRGYQIREV